MNFNFSNIYCRLVVSYLLSSVLSNCKHDESRTTTTQQLTSEQNNDLTQSMNITRSIKTIELRGELSDEVKSFTAEAMEIAKIALKYVEAEESAENAYRKSNPDCEVFDPAIAEAARKSVSKAGLDPQKNEEYFAVMALDKYTEKSITYLSANYFHEQLLEKYNKLKKSRDFCSLAIQIFFHEDLIPLLGPDISMSEAQIIHGETLLSSNFRGGRQYAAKWYLGLQLIGGYGCMKNEEAGMRHLEEIAEFYDKFTYGMAEYYRDGKAELIFSERLIFEIEFPTDMKKSMLWLLKSVENGYLGIEDYFSKMTTSQSTSILDVLENHASPAAPCVLCVLYFKGTPGIPANKAKAREYYKSVLRNTYDGKHVFRDEFYRNHFVQGMKDFAEKEGL